MTTFGDFAPFGVMTFGDDTSSGESMYRSMAGSVSKAMDVSVGTHVEGTIYARAQAFAAVRATLRHGFDQRRPLRAVEMLPALERNYSLPPAAGASADERRHALAARELLTRGPRRESLEGALRTLLGSDFVALVAQDPALAVTRPADPATVGAWDDPSIPPRFFSLLTSIADVGSPVAFRYQNLLGDGAALNVGDKVAVQPENSLLAEQVQVTGADGAAGTATATFLRSHDAGAIVRTHAPVWTSTQRTLTVLVTPKAANDPVVRAEIHDEMRRRVRATTQWSVVSSTGGVDADPLTLASTPIGTASLSPSTYLTPTTSSVAPVAVVYGGPAMTCAIYGAHFTPASIVSLGSTPTTTMYVDGGTLLFTLSLSARAAVQVYAVTVANPGTAASNAQTFSIDLPPAIVTSTSPASLVAGTGTTTITVLGSLFDSAATVTVNGSAVTTGFVDSRTLTAVVSSASLVSPGTLSIAVVNPTALPSNAQTFTVTYPTATTASLSPATCIAGATSVGMTVVGTNFYPASQISVNGSLLFTTYVDATHLSCVLTNLETAAAGTLSVDVINPSPAAPSNAQTFTVASAVPTLASVSPAKVYVGDAPQVVTLNGTSFTVTTVAQVDGTAQTTTYISSTQISFSLATPTAVHTSAITAYSPGSGTSGSVNLLVGGRYRFSTLTPGAISAGTLAALDSGNLVWTRASVGSVQTSATTIVLGVAVDTARCKSNGTRTTLLLEETRTTDIFTSRNPQSSSWHAVGSPTFTSGQTGPDGTTGACRVQCPNISGPYFVGPSGNGTFSFSSWIRSTTGTSGYQISGGYNGATGEGLAITGTIPATWSRLGGTFTVTGGWPRYLLPVDGGSETIIGGNSGSNLDCIVDCMQIEQGAFPTSYIDNSTTAALVRAGERCKHTAPANMIDGGRLGLLVTIYPIGASNEYTSALRVWTLDASNYCEINASTRVPKIMIGGTWTTLAALPTWARGDKLELWIPSGGGSLATSGTVRVNGTATDLSTGSAQTAIIYGANPLDLLCVGSSNQFSSEADSFEFFPAGDKPSWGFAA